ncbi:hypothetical protein [Methanococcoides alaskense]|uniref:Uncharacterized protein n=1 Tax=Methanococcoides alaskense TaxID=325778 RepID=A0AA90U165_9EURY|nr:hypothetical protein [Methanococcoides alaskense]MDR6223797.1 hypothetical protein [Methanococcoides alaskense]
MSITTDNLLKKIEGLLKRIEHFEKSITLKFSNLNTNLHELSRIYFFNLYSYLAREIKNEADIDLLKEYLVHTGQIDFRDYMEFKKAHPLMKTYVDENKNALKVINFFNNPICTPSSEPQLFNYVNTSNLLIQKERFKIKKDFLLERGYDIDSEEVIEIEGLIETYDEQIQATLKVTPFEEKKYPTDKKTAQNIYDGFLIAKEKEIVERIREIPSLNQIHLEPSCKELYFESISNYWLGNFNASIVLLSVFLEAHLKEKYYSKLNIKATETLTPLITSCFNNGIISSEQKDYLSDFAEKVRNNYIHVKTDQIITDVTLPVVKIDFTTSESVMTYSNSDECPVLRDIVKGERDKSTSKELILEIAEFVIETSESYEDIRKKGE